MARIAITKKRDQDWLEVDWWNEVERCWGKKGYVLIENLNLIYPKRAAVVGAQFLEFPGPLIHDEQHLKDCDELDRIARIAHGEDSAAQYGDTW